MSAEFFKEMARIGEPVEIDWTPNVYKTIISIPRKIFEITVDGAPLSLQDRTEKSQS